MSPDQSTQAGHPPRRVTGLVLLVVSALAVAAVVLTWGHARATDESASASPAPDGAVGVGHARSAAAVARFQRAVRTGDTAVAAGPARDGDAAASRWLEAVVGNATRLRLADVRLRYLGDDGAPRADGSWDAAVAATWRMRGLDPSTATADITLRLREEGGRVAVTGAGGGGRVSPLWLAGPLQVRRTADAVVLLDGSAASADRVASYAEHAVRVVRRVLPRWQGGLVVEVPASADSLEQVLAATHGSYDQVAAVTTSVDATTAPEAPVHVFVNPDVLDSLPRLGARVVISHEATHVATGAWTTRAPLWLTEGFADYVALRDVDLPLSRSAAQIRAEVRSDGAPRRLPGAAAFGSGAADLGATYESAWLVCRLIARRDGEDALVDLYRAVDRGRAVGPALASTVGLSVSELTHAWRRELEDLAS